MQGFSATDYLVVRTGETGSWLGSKFQDKGIGTAMRQAMDNPASLAVSRKVGYTDNGTVRVQRRPGELAWSRNLLLTRERFIRAEQPLRVEGSAPLRAAIGLTEAP